MPYPFGHISSDEMLSCNQVSETKQMSILFEIISVKRADGASGLASERALITKHFGITLVRGGLCFKFIVTIGF